MRTTRSGHRSRWRSSRPRPGPSASALRRDSSASFWVGRIESDFEVTQFEPNRKFASQSKSGPFPLQFSVTLEPIEGGTRVNTIVEGEPTGFFKLAEPLIVSVSKRQSQSDLDNLKDLMEANAL